MVNLVKLKSKQRVMVVSRKEKLKLFLKNLAEKTPCDAFCGNKANLNGNPWSTKLMLRVWKNQGNKLTKQERRNIKSGKIQIRDFFCQKVREDPKFCAEMQKTIPGSKIRLYRQLRKTRTVPINLPFTEYQTRVLSTFRGLRWGVPVVENHCSLRQKDETTRELKFSKTQEFISRFFVPRNETKGLLVYGSVGTGKTCAAILTASSEYEAEGWNILWVTRSTLKPAYYKNIFNDVCHFKMLRRLQQGKSIPNDQESRRRLLSKHWLPPVSYKTFSNAMRSVGKNSKGTELYKRLVRINGSADPLRKTLVIIDEAHNLVGGSGLKPQEEPNTNHIVKGLYNSYRVSGKLSVNVMLLTATPMVNSAMDSILLLNLLIPRAEDRFPFSLEDFKKRYLNHDGTFTERGIALFQEKSKGLISVLDRTEDPRQFAQITLHKIKVPISSIPDNNFDERLKICSDSFESEFNQCKKLNTKVSRDSCKERAKVSRNKCKDVIRKEKAIRKSSVNQMDQLKEKCKI